MDVKKPLAGMLPNTYEGKTAEELFPDFRPNAVSVPNLHRVGNRRKVVDFTIQ